MADTPAGPICEHVGPQARYMVGPSRQRGQVDVRCPCCNLHAYRDPDDDLDGDRCPYCDVQAVPA